jgi:hypothetical protein
MAGFAVTAEGASPCHDTPVRVTILTGDAGQSADATGRTLRLTIAKFDCRVDVLTPRPIVFDSSTGRLSSPSCRIGPP